MLVANIATLTIAKAHMVAFWLLQQAAAGDDAGTIGWDPIHLWKQMSWVAQVVVEAQLPREAHLFGCGQVLQADAPRSLS